MNIKGILCFGAEQSGKTSLAKKLCQMLGMDYVHMNPPVDVTDWIHEYTKDAFFAINKNKQLLLDRGYVCEMVYGPKLRNTNNITPEIQKAIEDFYIEHNYVAVLCHRNSFRESAWVDRDELCTYEENLDIRERYQTVFKTVSIPKVIVDPFEQSVSTIIGKIQNI